VLAERLGLPAWHAGLATVLQCRKLLGCVGADLAPEERRRARAAVARLYVRRHVRTAMGRGRKLAAMATGRAERRLCRTRGDRGYGRRGSR